METPGKFVDLPVPRFSSKQFHCSQIEVVRLQQDTADRPILDVTDSQISSRLWYCKGVQGNRKYLRVWHRLVQLMEKAINTKKPTDGYFETCKKIISNRLGAGGLLANLRRRNTGTHISSKMIELD